MRRRAAVATVGVLGLLAACGSSDSNAVRSEGPDVSASRVVTPTATKDALVDPPLVPTAGIPIVGDGSHLWITNFEQIAAYSVNAQEWVKSDLPWPRSRLEGLSLGSPEDGGLRGIAVVCEAECDVDNDRYGPVRVQAFTMDEASGQVITMIGEPTPVIEEIGLFTPISSDGNEVAWKLDLPEGGEVLTVGPDTVALSPYEADVGAVCPTSDGWVGVERVAVDQPGAVAWGPLPEGMEPQPGDALRFVAGSSPDTMTPADLPEGAQPVLANWVGLAMTCLPNGFALVGTSSAWEYVDRTWTEHPSSMSDSNLISFGGVARPAPGGQRFLTSHGSLLRTDDGTWSSVPYYPEHVILGGLDLTYTSPAEKGNPDGN